MLERDRKVYLTKAISAEKCLPQLLDRAGLPRYIADAGTILVKPNLVEALEPPITTPVRLIDDSQTHRELGLAEPLELINID